MATKPKTVEEYWQNQFSADRLYRNAVQRVGNLSFPCYMCQGQGRLYNYLDEVHNTCSMCNGFASFSYSQAKALMDKYQACQKQAKAALKEQAAIRKDLLARFTEAEVEWINHYGL